MASRGSRSRKPNRPRRRDASAPDEQRRDGFADQGGTRPADDTDVVLDVPMLKVEEIELEVEDLRAHVSARAELADFVRINVGVDVYLDKVKLSVKGVEAQVLLQVKLERILGTIERALDAIEDNPGLLTGALEDTDRAAGELAEDAGQGAEDATEGVTGSGSTLGETTDEAGRTVRRTVDEGGDIVETTLDEAGEVVEEVAAGNLSDLPIEEECVDGEGGIVGLARDETGNMIEETLDDEGNVVGVSDAGEGTGQDGASGPVDKGRVEATDAARRRAGELGVELENVKGTGSGGRVLVKDVESAAERG